VSPRDALKRIRSPFNAPETIGSLTKQGVVSPVSLAQGRLAAIMAEIAAAPIQSFFPQTQKRKDPSQALRWFVLGDVFAFLLSFAFAWIAAAFANILLLERGFPQMLEAAGGGARIAQYGVVVSGVMIWLWHTGHYRHRMPFWMETQKVAGVLFMAMVADGFFQFAAKQDFSRLWLTLGWAFSFVFVVGLRSLTRLALRKRGAWALRTLLVGGGPTADDARAALRSEASLGYDIVMQIDNVSLLLQQVDLSWDRLCSRFRADYVVIALDGEALSHADDALTRLARSGVPFLIAPPLRGLPVLGMTPQYFFSHDVMLLAPVDNLAQPLPRFLKRAIDIFGSGLALFVLSPIFVVLSFLVRRDGGTAFFGHKRIGMNGKTFSCYKFRSMVPNAEAALSRLLAEDEDARHEWAMTQKLREDPRITRVGAFMRRWSLDELPQLVNVFKGDMSLVGPRPIVFEETLRYREDISHYYRVRPGLTGLWQVSGRSDISFVRRVQMDIWYVRNWSLWHDIAILCKTFPAILSKTGAY